VRSRSSEKAWSVAISSPVSMFENWSVELDQVVDAGDDRVVAIYRQTAIGKGSGVPVEMDQGAINELHGGRVIRIRPYPSPAEALEAAGVSD
jgi:ketosteroid isomerase-like protein